MKKTFSIEKRNDRIIINWFNGNYSEVYLTAKNPTNAEDMPNLHSLLFKCIADYMEQEMKSAWLRCEDELNRIFPNFKRMFKP